MILDRKAACTAAWLALFVPAMSRAQDRPPVLATLLSEAEMSNPEIAAARSSAEAASARVPQAGALPDPMVGLGIMNFPLTDPSLGREMMTMTSIQASGQVQFFGKRGLREDVARFEAEAAHWEVARVLQNVRAEVKAAYYRIWFVDRALDVTRRNENLVGDFAQLTSTMYGVGTGAQPDVLKAQVERTRLADQLVALHAQRASAVARLNALLARATDTPLPHTELPEHVRLAALESGDGVVAFTSASIADIGQPGDRSPAPGIPTVAELQRLARLHNPMLQAHVRRVAARERAVSLARKARLPDFNLALAWSYRPDFGDFVNFMVSVPVPVFAARKQDQSVVEQAANLAQHQAMHHAMVDRIDGEIAALAAGLVRARAQLVLLNDGILPQARTGLASTAASYRTGRVDFLMLLDAQVTLYRHELEFHRLLADFAADLAALERAVGTEMLR
jgi:outer membrane protein TolC